MVAACMRLSAAASDSCPVAMIVDYDLATAAAVRNVHHIWLHAPFGLLVRGTYLSIVTSAIPQYIQLLPAGTGLFKLLQKSDCLVVFGSHSFMDVTSMSMNEWVCRNACHFHASSPISYTISPLYHPPTFHVLLYLTPEWRPQW